MSEEPAGIDFDAIYRGTFAVPGVAETGIPWDIAEAQPAVIEWERAGRFAGEVLDAGCGLGDNAIHVASRGHSVTGVDAAPTAIERARERASTRDVAVTFAVADAFALPDPGRYDTVLDSALYHCLEPHRRAAYATGLHRVSRPGARLNLLAVSDRAPENTPPSRVTEHDLRATLPAAGWEITALRETTITAVIPADALARFGLEVAGDSRGRVRLPAWAVEAVRR